VLTAPNMQSGVLGAPPSQQVPASAPVAAAEAQPTAKRVRAPNKSRKNVFYGNGKPVVSVELAKIIDHVGDLGELQMKAVMYRKAATLYEKGFTKSSTMNVVLPPNYAADAEKAGLPAPDVSREVTGALSAGTAPAEVVNVAQGEMVGKSGERPSTELKRKVASAEKAKVTKKPLAVGAAVGADSVGYTAEVPKQGVIAGEVAAKDVGVNLNFGGSEGAMKVAAPDLVATKEGEPSPPSAETLAPMAATIVSESSTKNKKPASKLFK